AAPTTSASRASTSKPPRPSGASRGGSASRLMGLSFAGLGLHLIPGDAYLLSKMEGGHFAGIEDLLRHAGLEQLQEAGDAPGPAGLVAGAEARPVVAVEVLVEQDQVAPVRVLLELPRSPVNRSPSISVSQEEVGEPTAYLLSHLIQVRVPAGA